MQQAIYTKLVAFFAMMALAFALAIPALAYSELEIDIEVGDVSTMVEVEYEESGEKMEKEFEFETTDLDEVYQAIADELGISVDAVEAALENEDGEEDEEMSDMEEAAEAIADAEAAIADAAEYLEEMGSSSDDYVTKSGYLDTAKGYLAEAETAFENEDYDAASDWAEKAEDKVEDHILPEDEDEDEDGEEKDRSDYCDKTKQAAGFGVAKKCVGEDGYVVNDKLADKVERFADFGKSTDKAVLQGQLRELLIVLIQLLQAQMALEV